MKNRSNIRFILHTIIASFGAYFCMYAFRKPFTVATYENLAYFNIDYKILLIIAQVLGYVLSKFLGIKLISQLKREHRAFYLIGLIALAEVALILFASVPPPYNIIFMFMNGIPLGMIWGIVFSYLEGRKQSEILGVFLSSSFIVSSGIVKSVGKYFMDHWHITEFWMPAVTGAIFFIPLVLCSKMLERIPPPNAEDIALKTERIPMTAKDRRQLLKQFIVPIVMLVFFYTLLTAFRDFRDNFARELWDALGDHHSASIYTLTEIPIAIGVLVILGIVGMIKDNKKAFRFYHYLLVIGSVMIGVSTLEYQLDKIGPALWMICTGFGLYLCYVPFNCIFFDRMIAAFKIKGNAGFLIYLADSFGYLGSVVAILYKNFGQQELSWLSFFTYGAYTISILGFLITISSLFYFNKKSKKYNHQIEYNFNTENIDLYELKT
ncbi:DUF5690 family protein [Flavobacterium sp. '19STA2R22 D10 B1']|uniref:DUF5690 family protein n=1 Tax=Flavobacterium aerium TaxID=3037261 RepID=UPI00278C76B5|nr:DUF5690 family protein [Flavobacterium sp. '19STA2R22 D10 B1']